MDQKNVSSKRSNLECFNISKGDASSVVLSSGFLTVRFVPLSIASVIVQFTYGYEFAGHLSFTNACEHMSQIRALSLFDQLVNDGFK